MSKRKERTITAALIISEMCKELHMTEEQLLVHLAVEASETQLSEKGKQRVLKKAAVYHEKNIFMVER